MDNYEHVADALEKEARKIDLGDHVGALEITMLGRTYEMRAEGLHESGEYCRDSWAKIIIYDYLNRQESRPLTGEWVGLGFFPDTASYVKAFNASAERNIAAAFPAGLDDLASRSEHLGGVSASGESSADVIYRFDVLPKIPLFLCFWEGDEDFEASCKLFVDRNVEHYLDIEYLAHLVDRFATLFLDR